MIGTRVFRRVPRGPEATPPDPRKERNCEPKSEGTSEGKLVQNAGNTMVDRSPFACPLDTCLSAACAGPPPHITPYKSGLGVCASTSSRSAGVGEERSEGSS